MLLAAEIGLRLVGFSYPLFPEKIEFGFPGPEVLESWYQPDRDLFWVRERYPNRLRRARGVDLVFMGDSCTEFARYDLYLAELASSRSPGSTFSYLNAGTGGWTSHQGLRQLERDIVPLRPKAITIYYGWNDHWIGFGIEDKRAALMHDSLLFHLRSLRLVQLADRARLASTGRGTDRLPERVSPVDFKANLRAMVRIARENDIVPLLLTAPTSHKQGREPGYLVTRWVNRLDEVVPLHQRYVEAVREIAADEGCALCDLEAAFSEIPRARLVRDYFSFDGVHLTEKGEREVARQLLACLEEHDLLGALLRPEAEAIALPGRLFPSSGPTTKEPETPPDLPTRLEIETAEHTAEDGLDIAGWILSPRVVDDVVVYVDGENLGTASHPASVLGLERPDSEFADHWIRFQLSRPLEKKSGPEHECRVEVYSDDELIVSQTQSCLS